MRWLPHAGDQLVTTKALKAPGEPSARPCGRGQGTRGEDVVCDPPHPRHPGQPREGGGWGGTCGRGRPFSRGGRHLHMSTRRGAEFADAGDTPPRWRRGPEAASAHGEVTGLSGAGWGRDRHARAGPVNSLLAVRTGRQSRRTFWSARLVSSLEDPKGRGLGWTLTGT